VIDMQGGEGIGWLIWNSWQLFLTDRMYVGIVSVALFGVVFQTLVMLAGRWAAPWARLDSQLSWPPPHPPRPRNDVLNARGPTLLRNERAQEVRLGRQLSRPSGHEPVVLALVAPSSTWSPSPHERRSPPAPPETTRTFPSRPRRP
jgi:hypothetical protein